MFDDISKTYDLANRLLSLGVDVRWRKIAAKAVFGFLGKKEIEKIVDVACGTGDMMRFWSESGAKEGVNIKEIVGIDPSGGMLEVAKKKLPQFAFIQSEAKSIPLDGNIADVVSITYGIRNVLEREAAFREFFRILKSGGILMILEFTKSQNPNLFEKFMRFYIKKMLPFIGGLVSKNYEAYRYLPNSIENFLTNEMMEGELKSAGFEILKIEGYSGNVSTMFIARKPC